MRKHLATAGIALLFATGLSILLYPSVAGYINSQRQSRVVSQYYYDVENLDAAVLKEMLAEAHEYNKELRNNPNRFYFTQEQSDEYMRILNPDGSGVMGVLIINRIDVKLPIYHGTDEKILQSGTGHFEGSSLPVGGPSTHSVITGHRGLPSSTLLTDLDRLVVGDVFILHILNQVLTYEIDQILVVEPEELKPLAIEVNEDFCTLITCTPYAINSHRLLLRGRRVDNEGSEIFIPDSEARAIKPLHAAFVMTIPVIVVVSVALIFRFKRIRKGG